MRATDRTLPTLGAIKKQTISGAISTGTHGSGKQSLSHFVAAVRAAVFDGETGAPVVREFNDGPELLAARCGLGCFGVILSVDLHTVPKYQVAETLRDAREHRGDHRGLCGASAQPFRRLALQPEDFWSIHRKPVEYRRQTFGARIKARLFRLFGLLVQDTGFHIAFTPPDSRGVGRSGPISS